MYRLFYVYFISIFISILFLIYFYIISIAAGHTGWAGCAGLAGCCVVLGCGLGWGGWAAPCCSRLFLAPPGCSWLLRLSLAIPGRPFPLLAAPWVFPCCSLTSLAVACPPWLVPGRSLAAPWLLPGLPDCSLASMDTWLLPGLHVSLASMAPQRSTKKKTKTRDGRGTKYSNPRTHTLQAPPPRPPNFNVGDLRDFVNHGSNIL